MIPKGFWLLYGVLVIVTFFCLWWWLRDEGALSPSREEVLQHNYYLFVLPETALSNYGWDEHISLVRWENKCFYTEVIESYNPLTIRYDNKDSDFFFIVRIDLWNRSRRDIDTETIPFEKSWVPSRKITRFLQPDNSTPQTRLMFLDHVGNPVYIDSSLSTEETLELVESLELIEPEGMTNFDPWGCFHETR